MAGSASDYAENKLLESIVGKTAFSVANAYVALCTAAPTDASTGATIVEPTYTGYARKSAVGADWAAAAGGSISNVNAITFNPCTAGTSTVGYFAICDASGTGAGNVLIWGSLNASIAVSAGIVPQFAAGTLTISLD